MRDSSLLSRGPAAACVRYRPLLALLRTGALSRREADELHEHVSRCPWCQQELAAYDALDAAARNTLTAVACAPLTLEDVVRAAEVPPVGRAAVTTGAGRTLGSAVRRRRLLATLGPLAAVIALALAAGLIFATHRPGPSATPGSGTPARATSPAQTGNLAQTSWTLTRLVVDGREQQTVRGRAPTLHFGTHDGQVYGSGSCNGYGGTYTLTGDTLLISSLYYTQMACMPAGVDAQESAYFQALPRIERYRLEGNTLTLTSADGTVQLTFQAS